MISLVLIEEISFKHTMVPVTGWIIGCVCTILTLLEVYWDTSRKVYQQIDQNKTDPARQKMPYFPSWSWARNILQYILCLLNIWISITAYDTFYFSLFFSISAVVLFMDMQLYHVKGNATYLRLQYGSKRNPVGMAIFYTSAVLMLAICIMYNVCMYTKLMHVDHVFAMFWNSMLFVYFVCHSFHSFVYWRVTYTVVYSRAQLSGSVMSFKEMYDYRLTGIIDRAIVHFILILLFIFGNIYGRQYVFYLYVYPFCMLLLQIGNFQSDYRNTIPFPRCIRDCHMNRVSLIFDEAVKELKLKEKIEREGRTKKRTELKEYNEGLPGVNQVVCV